MHDAALFALKRFDVVEASSQGCGQKKDACVASIQKCVVVVPSGIEPLSEVPETSILSVELRDLFENRSAKVGKTLADWQAQIRIKKCPAIISMLLGLPEDSF